MREETVKCQHPACNCWTAKGTKYCSQYCEDAKDTIELSCNCCHAGCAMSEQRPAA
jgi:hypothetical protein